MTTTRSFGRWVQATSAVLAVAGLAGCAPVDDAVGAAPNSAGVSPIPDTPITEAEQAVGVAENETGQDYSEPADGIDDRPGVTAASLAPSFSEAGGSDGAFSTFVEATTACRPTTGYSRGNPTRICVVTVEGKLIEVNTARAYEAMRNAARAAGISISLTSGFRTMDQQRYLYNLYLSGRGNLAARPGYSNHQSGLALDLGRGPGGQTWLDRNASRYGFRRTVPSEPWHWERPAGSQANYANTGGSTQTTDQCYSQTMGRTMPEGTCVQSRFDELWYHCRNGAWHSGRSNCTASHPLGSTSTGTNNVASGCHSSTLNRVLSVDTCLQSRFDSEWYQCSTIGWVQNSSIPSTRRGYAGACTQYLPR